MRLAPLLFLAALAAARPQDEEHPRVRQPPPTPEEIAELPADGGPEFNRLVHEKSPYLLQHARNPVDWYPWGEEAFARAAKEDKPVLLSIGYSTCHWCHVMEHESFEDDEVAALMNAGFVCIKVDREERPDVDQVYMTFMQEVVGGRGGWPLTVFLTPDKRPFFAGTYFPKRGAAGRPGMMELLPAVRREWDEGRERLLEQVEKAVEYLAARSGGSPGAALGVRTLELAATQLAERFDQARGGFGTAPKFPVPHNARFLLRWWKRSGSEPALSMVERTLEEMQRGGIWDHVGFGYHRYSTDRNWFLPHFEKMLYDQALIAMAYVEAWQATGEAEHRETAERIFEYVLRDMTSPEGGFYSAEDADSEGEEGLFYLWSVAELKAVLGEEDGAFAARVFGATEAGNFREEASGQRTGKNILYLQASVADTAAELGLEPAELAQRIESMRRRLFDAREGRVHPLKDDKVLTDWNGLMISALARAASAFAEPRYALAATRAADFALEHLRDEHGRLFKRYRQGAAGLDGMLEDYAFLGAGLFDLYEATQRVEYLRAAKELTDAMLAHFWDAKGSGLFLAPDDGEALVVRSKEIYDGALPSGNSVAALNLLRLARATGEPSYEERARQLFRAFSGDVARQPSVYTELLLALDFAEGPAFEVVVAGEPDAADTRAMLRALQRELLPNKVVLFRPQGATGEEQPEIAKLAPFTAGQVALEGAATAYVCQNFACRAPTTDVGEMLALVRGQGGGDEEGDD